MSKARRAKSLYSDKPNVITPDLMKQQQVILKSCLTRRSSARSIVS